MIHSKNVSILCQIFPSSLKGVASDWFYPLPQYSVHIFEDLTKLFLTQYTFRQEFKQSNHHLLSIKMRSSDSFKTTLATFRISWPKYIIAAKMLLPRIY